MFKLKQNKLDLEIKKVCAKTRECIKEATRI
jgi:hypothetical protein